MLPKAHPAWVRTQKSHFPGAPWSTCRLLHGREEKPQQLVTACILQEGGVWQSLVNLRAPQVPSLMSFFYLKKFVFFTSVCLLLVFMCTTCVQCLPVVRRGRLNAWNESYRQCEQLCGCWDLKPGLLQEWPVLWMDEPSVQHHSPASWALQASLVHRVLWVSLLPLGGNVSICKE